MRRLSILSLTAALTLVAAVPAGARQIYVGAQRQHPPRRPPITCDPPKVARLVTVVIHHYQARHEWRCVRP